MSGGVDRISGRTISDTAHIRQSIRDILTTRIGTRVMRRDYGSVVPDLIDHPAPTSVLKLQAGAIMALTRWEPRIVVTRITVAYALSGEAVIDLDAILAAGPRAGSAISLSVSL